MTKEEELQALREENRTLKALVAELLPLKEQLAQATARIKELEERLAKDSRTSSKPPSSDGLARLPRSARRPSGKRPGGQTGHPGHTLSLVEQPDEVVRHRPEVCSQCGEDLSRVPGSVAERRQVLDVPEIRLLAQEHQIEAICCPTCHTRSLGSFPAAVNAPVQYGPHLQALAVYLHQGQLLPTARTCEALAAICGCQIAEGTLIQWSELAAERLAPTVERIAELIGASQLQHGAETGIRVYGMLHWLHVNCTRFLTHLAWHGSRGREAMDEIGIWPRFAGRGMHDRLVSYDAYDCAHSICGAHLVRDGAGVAEQEQQEWAVEMQDFLLDLQEACQEWRLLHLTCVPAIERDEWVARYARDSGGGLCRSTAPTRAFRRIAQRPAQAKPGQESAGCAALACRSSAGFARRPADSFYQQPGRAGPSLGESAAKDCWHLSQCDGGHRFLPHPQFSFDDAQARTPHALCSGCCLSWSPFTGRLGT
jgi:transposase